MSNPKDSKWFSTPAVNRKRRELKLTLSDEARAALEEMAGAGGRSALVDKLIMEAYAATANNRRRAAGQR